MLGKDPGAPPACGAGAKLLSPSVPALVCLSPARLGVCGEGSGSGSPAPPAEHVSQAPHPCVGHLWAQHGLRRWPGLPGRLAGGGGAAGVGSASRIHRSCRCRLGRGVGGDPPSSRLMLGLGEPLAKVCLGESTGKQVKTWGHDSPEVLGETVSEILRSGPGRGPHPGSLRPVLAGGRVWGRLPDLGPGFGRRP